MSQLHVEEGQWMFSDSPDAEQLRDELRKGQRKLEREWHKLEFEKKQFQKQRRSEEQRVFRETQLFETKWKILEEEYAKLAKEKQEFETRRQQYESLHQEEPEDLPLLQEGLFFSGVSNELGMKKRYKDLIKIFHPDNLDGDTKILQRINREYDEMKRIFCE